jgi:hypothetical protein
MTRSKKTATKVAEEAVESSPVSPTQGRPKALVFISHDSRNADLAEAFANLLSDVSGGTLKSFRSSDKRGTTGIEFGAEWFSTIMAQLADATDVVALLTPQSLDRPWILYEAGVAKGKLDTTLFGLALGAPLEKVSAGPFGQFQNCADDEDSLTKLVVQLLRRNPDAEPREEAVRTQVKIFKDKVSKILSATPKAKAPEPEEQNIAKLFEEVKAMVKEIPEQLDGRFQTASKRNGRRQRKLDPGFLHHLLHRYGGDDIGGPSNAFLMALSVLRDDFPWIYEAGKQVVDAYLSGNRAKFESSRESFMQAMKFLSQSKIAYEFFGDDREMFYLREYVDMFGSFLYSGPMSERPPEGAPLSHKPKKRRIV